MQDPDSIPLPEIKEKEGKPPKLPSLEFLRQQIRMASVSCALEEVIQNQSPSIYSVLEKQLQSDHSTAVNHLKSLLSRESLVMEDPQLTMEILKLVGLHKEKELFPVVLELVRNTGLPDTLHLAGLHTLNNLMSPEEYSHLNKLISVIPFYKAEIRAFAIAVILNHTPREWPKLSAIIPNLAELLIDQIDPQSIVEQEIHFTDSQKLIIVQAIQKIARPAATQALIRLLKLSSLQGKEHTKLYQAVKKALSLLTN